VTDVPRITGVLSPVVTPFGADLAPDPERFVRQCRWLLSQNVGLAIFGTNSEANSLSVEEKIELLDRLVAAGLDPARMMPGTGCCALTDSVRLTAHAMKLGCGGALMLPPFYYKGVSDDGLFRNFAEIIERVGDRRLRIYLYHIPPVSQVAITLPLIERLLKAYPGIIAGAKDSSGDWNNTKAYIDNFAGQGFDVFPGSETFLLQGMRAFSRKPEPHTRIVEAEDARKNLRSEMMTICDAKTILVIGSALRSAGPTNFRLWARTIGRWRN